MTNEPAVHPAEEGLLDAALTQLFAGKQHQRGRGRTPASWSPWLAAALLLLGVGVTTAVMWLARTGRVDTAQEPAPLPPEVTGEGKAELEALPATTENLLAKLVDPTDLSVVARFNGLRSLRLSAEKLRVAGFSTGQLHTRWSKPADDTLASIAKLRHLETLQLPPHLAITPALLAPLAGHETLRKLKFIGDGITIDAPFAEALAAIPKLRSLHLMFVTIDGAALRHLARLPLVSLELEWCSGLDAAGWQSLLTMRDLQHLSFKNWAWSTKQVEAGTPPPWRPAAEDVRRLGGLPLLRSLELLHCQLEDDQLAALPDTLSELLVFGTKLTPAGLAGLRRLGGLRKLDLDASLRGDSLAALFAPDSVPAAEAVAEALLSLHLQSLRYVGALSPALAQAIGSQSDLRDLSVRSKQIDSATVVAMLGRLSLQRFSWNGPLTPELLQAIAAQPRLQEVELANDDITLITPLAASRTLQRLVLRETATGDGIAPAVLTPLARCGSLQELEVHAFVARDRAHPSQLDLQRAVGDRVRLHLHETEVAVKR